MTAAANIVKAAVMVNPVRLQVASIIQAAIGTGDIFLFDPR